MATAYLALAISESDVNIANNTSSVQVTVYAYGNGVSWNNNAPGTVTVAGEIATAVIFPSVTVIVFVTSPNATV